MKRFPAGRMNEAPSTGLSASLRSAGFQLGRLQTGTPARLDGNTINFSNMERQDGDTVPLPFSYMHETVDNAVSADVLHFPLQTTDSQRFCVGQSSGMLSDLHYTRHSSSN